MALGKELCEDPVEESRYMQTTIIQAEHDRPHQRGIEDYEHSQNEKNKVNSRWGRLRVTPRSGLPWP